MNIGDQYILRDGTIWTYTGRTNSSNILAGINQDKPMCLFASLKYRMDDQQHEKDVIKKVE